MPELCLITTCMGRLTHLQQTLGAAASQPNCSCIVVDYSCPDRCGDWVEQHHPSVKVVRVLDEKFFNASRARNRGAAAADAPWLCFFDADVKLKPHFSEQVLPLLAAGNFYLVTPQVRDLVGTVICPRPDFINVGSYDEMIQSWGAEDRDIYDRFVMRGLRQQTFPQECLEPITHGDDLRVQHYPVKSAEVSHVINTLYRLAKFDLMKILGKEVAEADRRNLYAEATRVAQLCFEKNQEVQWRIPYRAVQALGGQVIQSTIHVSLTPRKKAT